MESVLGWLGQLMETLGSLIPTWHHLECTDVGVTVKRGKRIKRLAPGIVWYWPFWTSLYHRPANIQTMDLPVRTLTTTDGKRVAVGGMIRYQIDDVLKALIDTDNVERSIRTESLAVLCELVTAREANAIVQPDLAEDLTECVQERLERFGVVVEQVALTDCSTCMALVHVGIHRQEEE